MRTFEEVLTHFHSFLESATYLDVVPCRWGYVRLFNEGDPINFNAILCRTPQELYTALETILDKGIMPSEKVLDFPVDCNTLTGSVNL